MDTEENKDLVETMGVDLVPCFHFYKGPGTRKDFLAEFDKDNLEAKLLEKIAVSQPAVEESNEIVNTEENEQSETMAELIK